VHTVGNNIRRFLSKYLSYTEFRTAVGMCSVYCGVNLISVYIGSVQPQINVMISSNIIDVFN